MNTFKMNNILAFFILCVISLGRTQSEESKCSGPNEEYTCGVKCPKTCTNLDIAIQCLSGCDEGCFCKEGYVRNEETSECVKPTECPTCGHNETYKSNGFACQTCTNHQYVRCPSLNEYRCYCLPGYVRDAEDNCVNPEDCPVVSRYTRSNPEGSCGQNESYESKGIACLTCKNYQTSQCALLNEYRCYCYPGYVRDANGNCVHPDDCPVNTRYTRNSPEVQCNRLNEEYSRCQLGPCEATCQHTEKDIACAAVCVPHGCRCKRGFLRDAITRECVLEANCP